MTATRVTLITEQLRQPVPGGIGTNIRGLVQGLRESSDHTVDVRTWQSRLPVPVRRRLWDYGVGRVRGDVVHAASLNFPPTSAPLVVTIMDLTWRDVPETFAPGSVEWHERNFQRALTRADHIVVPSTLTLERILAAGAPPERVTLIECGCDHLPPADDAGAARLVEGEFLLTVGTREPRKNLARLVEAYRQARPRFPEPLPLVVVGPYGWGEPDDLGDVVTTGLVDDAVLAGLYARARAFAYVPLIEGFGLPVVEAMRAGTPVVTSTRVPSAGGAALEVDPLDVDAIADALVATVTDGDVRRDLVARGTARAAQITWRNAADQHVALWRSLAASR
ncbi:MAG TPA: glycosyltransferase family 1 protein [Acidimicrobiales bacterium]|nr:glycosyltransferase family 1 protein [Acidimicrobiales bacterium]